MLLTCRTPQRGRRSPGRATAAGVALLLATAGCSSESAPAEQSPAAPTSEATPLADYDTSGLTLARGQFCARITDAVVAAALDDDPTAHDAWRPGTRLPGSKEISNEFGCSFSRGSLSATAWVFAPPITPERAADFVGEVVGDRCRRLRDAPELGGPSVAQECSGTEGRTGIYGLVGDAWVGCEISGLTGSASEDTDLVGEWCVAVLEALRTT